MEKSNNNQNIEESRDQVNPLELEIEYITSERASIILKTKIHSSLDIKRAASTIYQTVSELENCEIAKFIQNACYEKSGFYYPIDKTTAKMERLLVTIAANYPQHVSINLLSNELAMDKKTISAYVTSANNWTSQYLHIENDSDISVTSAGLRIALEKTKNKPAQ